MEYQQNNWGENLT